MRLKATFTILLFPNRPLHKEKVRKRKKSGILRAMPNPKLHLCTNVASFLIQNLAWLHDTTTPLYALLSLEIDF